MLVASFFRALQALDSKFVPYRGGAPAVQDLVAGQTTSCLNAVTNSLPHVRARQNQIYASLPRYACPRHRISRQ